MLLTICEKKLAIFASTGNYFRPWPSLSRNPVSATLWHGNSWEACSYGVSMHVPIPRGETSALPVFGGGGGTLTYAHTVWVT